MTDDSDFVQGLPKAELHIHIEGSLEPEMMWDVAQRNGISLPFGSVDAIRQAYEFTCLQDFLDVYYAGMQVLKTERDFFDLADAYFRRAERDNVRHIECFFDPQAHLARGIPLARLMDGLSSAVRKARDRGVSVSLILCLLRHLSERDAFRMLEDAMPYRSEFIGVGLDSSELGNPPSKFERVFCSSPRRGLQPHGPRRRGGAALLHLGSPGPARSGAHRSWQQGTGRPCSCRSPAPGPGTPDCLPAFQPQARGG